MEGIGPGKCTRSGRVRDETAATFIPGMDLKSRRFKHPVRRGIGCEIERYLMGWGRCGRCDSTAEARSDRAMEVPANDALHIAVSGDDGFKLCRALQQRSDERRVGKHCTARSWWR